MLTIYEPTPCGVMFDLLKRRGGITHRELAGIVLSKRPLPSGRSPRDLAHERSWLSHSVVHAPVGSLSPRYFGDWGGAAVCVLGRLRSRRGRAMTADEVVSMLAGEPGRAMDRALELCREDACLYRNAVERFAGGEGLVPGERAEALLVLFVAAGCSADARAAVSYAMEYAHDTLGTSRGHAYGESGCGCGPGGSLRAEYQARSHSHRGWLCDGQSTLASCLRGRRRGRRACDGG